MINRSRLSPVVAMVATVSGLVVLSLTLPLPALAMKVITEKTVTGFKFPEGFRQTARCSRSATCQWQASP